MWRPRSLRFRYSLRALLVFITLFMLWGGFHAERGYRERQAQNVLKRRCVLHYGHRYTWLQPAGWYERIVQTIWREPCVTGVAIGPAPTSAEIAAIASLPQLQWLEVSHYEMPVVQVPDERNLIADRHPALLPPEALSTILSKRRLKSLHISQCTLNAADYQAIGEHDSLEFLQINGARISDSDLPALFRPRGLQTINLVQSQFTGAGMDAMPGSPELRDMRCQQAPVCVDFARFLRKCPRLETLLTCGPSVDDAFVQALEQHPTLSEISFCGNSVTDKAIDSLLTLPKLSWVAFGGNRNVSKAARQRLSAARPGLVIQD